MKSETRSTLNAIDFRTYFAARNRGMRPDAANAQAQRVQVAFIENELKRHGGETIYMARGVTVNG